jgi:hypothetical protein
VATGLAFAGACAGADFAGLDPGVDATVAGSALVTGAIVVLVADAGSGIAMAGAALKGAAAGVLAAGDGRRTPAIITAVASRAATAAPTPHGLLSGILLRGRDSKDCPSTVPWDATPDASPAASEKSLDEGGSRLSNAASDASVSPIALRSAVAISAASLCLW